MALLVLSRLTTAVDQFPQYSIAYLVWQLPYAVVTVSVITALLPRMSRHAVAEQLDLTRSDLDRGLCLSAVLVITAALGLLVLGQWPSACSLAARPHTPKPTRSAASWHYRIGELKRMTVAGLAGAATPAAAAASLAPVLPTGWSGAAVKGQ